MKKAFIVSNFVFDTKEEAKAFAIALISGKNLGSKWNSDSSHYASAEFISDSTSDVSIKEKIICETEREAQEKTDIEIMKKKMGVFEKEQENTNIPFNNIPF